MKYTTTFKKAVLRKVLPPENRSVHSVSMELGVGEMTIHRWIAQVKDGTINFEQDEENPSGQRNMTEKLNLLLEYQKIPQDLGGELKQQEYQIILDALIEYRGSRQEVSEKLGISPRTLRYKIAKMREMGMIIPG